MDELKKRVETDVVARNEQCFQCENQPSTETEDRWKDRLIQSEKLMEMNHRLVETCERQRKATIKQLQEELNEEREYSARSEAFDAYSTCLYLDKAIRELDDRLTPQVEEFEEKHSETLQDIMKDIRRIETFLLRCKNSAKEKISKKDEGV